MGGRIDYRGLLLLVIGLGLLFDFLNGFNDSCNMVATVISSRAMAPKKALALAAVAEFCGPFLFGTAVATTIGKGVVDPHVITPAVILAALAGAIAWNLVTWYFGIPSSSSHALVGGIVGAVSIGSGVSYLHLDGLSKIVLVLVTSPILGLILGFLFMKLTRFLTRGTTPGINFYFKRLQILTTIGLALSHGANDAQKTMGMITMSLVTLGFLNEFVVPRWVIFFCALTISLGIASGGWKIIKTVGMRIYKIRPVHAFSVQYCSAGIILGAALIGSPVSTTHVVSSSVMGVGSAERFSAVRWEVVKNIILTWVITIPGAAIISILFYQTFKYIAKIG